MSSLSGCMTWVLKAVNKRANGISTVVEGEVVGGSDQCIRVTRRTTTGKERLLTTVHRCILQYFCHTWFESEICGPKCWQEESTVRENGGEQGQTISKIGQVKYTVAQKWHHFLCARFSQLFHYQNREKIFNSTITKDPPQVCGYTTLWNVKCMSQRFIDRAIGQWRRRLEWVVLVQQQDGHTFDVKTAGCDSFFRQ